NNTQLAMHQLDTAAANQEAIAGGFDISEYDIAPLSPTAQKLFAYKPLSFHHSAQPLVSIIIPVYNQFNYTYNCLAAILRHTENIDYEVIIADDCSTDNTVNIGKIVSGIQVVTTPENMRFLKNCNYAAKQARGKYIFFLNNDTQVQAGWLSELLRLIENDDTIGMVGSKLIYPTGQLQEAGGIVWDDASAWNFGQKQDPHLPEFNYVKECDYISGAAIMIRHSLWQDIGGFDETFTPAYYEDVDLAMAVRARGKRVILQPLSIVIHFEGVSNGTDVTAGVKKYQVDNQKKFFDKWQTVLLKEHFPNAQEVLLARDRSRFKKHILVVDHYVPHYDQDAGGRCIYMYLRLFVEMGLQVTFIGDNFYKHEPYTTHLEQLGIEVLYGNYYHDHYETWLQENLKYYDYVYLLRPHIASKYMDIVKEYSNAKVFYFAVDLAHIRLQREFELTGDQKKLEEAKHWREVELKLFSQADVGHVVGSYEQGVLKKIYPEKPIRNIPLYIYEQLPQNINRDFASRHDLLFVGGFKHQPNVDAVLWFAHKIFPAILAKYPKMIWHVVGNNVPEEIKSLASEHVIIEGRLSDEELGNLYRTCRLAVVPLRFGAGVKGKVVESAYYQIPLVTTSIGAEGLDATMGNMVVVDDEKKIAETINNLYTDFNQLSQMSQAGKTYIEKYFTKPQALKVLRMDIDSQ
ncbi:glycosyltransferase, partial [bacterium]|nr:glycosyltransferase [bacterium]